MTANQQIFAWDIQPQLKTPLEPAPVSRDWMDAIPERYAYRCLPLTVANQAGWIIRSPVRVTARWNGGTQIKDLRLWFAKNRNDDRVLSHFGSGILTFTLPFLFRTPPGLNLWVKGPANYFKDGIQPLEGVVETDWSQSTFTMNWKLTRPQHTIRFDEGEPICMIVPVPRGLVESLEPIRRPLSDNPDLLEQYETWRTSRRAFNAALARGDAAAREQGWQKDYMLGRVVSGERVAGHQTRLAVREFLQE
ncbi:MAG: hypothetical protein JSS02_11155 [Planctomycetes bacterium]|nr:hypothetical protein [Planctomycetota bacterium]